MGLSLTLPPLIFFTQVRFGACYFTGQWGQVQNNVKKPNPNPSPEPLLPSITFHNKSCAFMILLDLSFLRLVHGLSFIREGNIS